MYPQNGRLPAYRALIALMTIFMAASVVADSRLPLTLAEAEDIALSAEPGREMFLARAEMFNEQSVAAGQLPDPTLRIGLANYPISGGSFSTEGMTQAQLGIRQAFPKGDSRTHATSQYVAMAEGQTLAADARLRDVRATVQTTWLEAYYWNRARQVLLDSRPFFTDLVSTTQSMYAVGRKTQYDVLRAELELARLDDRLIDAGRSLAAAQASLSQWLGDDAYRLPATNLPKWDALPSLVELQSGLQANPLLLSAGASVKATRASVNLAEANKKPGWALDLGYGYRDGMLANGQPRSDFVNLSVSVDLPMFSKNRQDRKLSAALSEQSAANANRDRVHAELRSKLALQFSRWQELTRRMALYETQILDLSDSQAEAAMLAYQSDAGPFSDVMLGYIDNLNIRLEHIRLQIDRAQSFAALASLGGLPR